MARSEGKPDSSSGRGSDPSNGAVKESAPVPPSPKESAVLQVNQQFVQRIPPMALDRLQPDQIAGLVEASFVHSDKADERRYRFAMERMRRQNA